MSAAADTVPIEFLTRQEVADLFRVSIRTVPVLVKRYGLPKVALTPTIVRYPAEAVRQLIADCTVTPPPAAPQKETPHADRD